MAPTPLKPDNGGSLVQRAMTAVTQHIRAENLRVGDSLPGEAHFAATLGVSRPVIREAFGALAALQLIDVGNGRKPRVAAIDGAPMASSLHHAVNTSQITVSQVWDVRRTIEARTAALAAEHRTDREARAIADLAEAMAQSLDDLPQVARHDIAFHDAIARATHNALFVQIVGSFADLMGFAIPTAWGTRLAASQRELMVSRHHAVADAILRRDPDGAAAAMGAHFDASLGDLLKGMAAAKDSHDS